jgi:hypothetical protein
MGRIDIRKEFDAVLLVVLDQNFNATDSLKRSATLLYQR